MYTGKLCPKCGTLCGKETTLHGLEVQKKRFKARYGTLPCNDCIIESVGGEKEVERIRSEEILKEMGL